VNKEEKQKQRQDTKEEISDKTDLPSPINLAILSF
jgi:hypothetical protein